MFVAVVVVVFGGAGGAGLLLLLLLSLLVLFSLAAPRVQAKAMTSSIFCNAGRWPARQDRKDRKQMGFTDSGRSDATILHACGVFGWLFAVYTEQTCCIGSTSTLH